MDTARKLAQTLRRDFFYHARKALRQLLWESDFDLQNAEKVVAVLGRNVSVHRTILEEYMQELVEAQKKQYKKFQDKSWDKKTNAEQAAVINIISDLQEKIEFLEILLSDDILQSIISLRQIGERFAAKMQSSEGE